MTTGKNTKLGRPLSPKGKKRVRKALSLDPDVLDRAEISAGLRDISLSMYFELAIKNQIKIEHGASGAISLRTEEQEERHEQHLAKVLAELKDSTASLERTVASLLPESAKVASPLHSLPTPPATKRGGGNKAN